MSENVLKLIVAIGRLSVQQKQNRNQSESGVFLAMLQIMAEKPDTELFPLGELNSYLDYTRPNLSQTINKLEDKNYVERVTLKDDRRVTYIRLTEEGKEMLQEKHSSIADRMNRIKDVLGEEDINKLIELLTRFIDTYEKTEYTKNNEIIICKNTADLLMSYIGYSSYEEMINSTITVGVYGRANLLAENTSIDYFYDDETANVRELIDLKITGISSIENDTMRMVFFNNEFAKNAITSHFVENYDDLYFESQNKKVLVYFDKNEKIASGKIKIGCVRPTHPILFISPTTDAIITVGRCSPMP